MLSIRSRISPAALFVNVIAMIWYGLTPFSSIKYAARCVSTLVLPEPAPANMSTGPSVWQTARSCISFMDSCIRPVPSIRPYLPFLPALRISAFLHFCVSAVFFRFLSCPIILTFLMESVNAAFFYLWFFCERSGDWVYFGLGWFWVDSRAQAFKM